MLVLSNPRIDKRFLHVDRPHLLVPFLTLVGEALRLDRLPKSLWFTHVFLSLSVHGWWIFLRFDISGLIFIFLFFLWTLFLIFRSFFLLLMLRILLKVTLLPLHGLLLLLKLLLLVGLLLLGSHLALLFDLLLLLFHFLFLDHYLLLMLNL